MILLLHIVIALSSMAYTTYLFFSPSDAKFNMAYTLIILTLMSGFYLVVTSPVHILQTCTTGLLYIGFVSCGIAFAHRKLALERNQSDIANNSDKNSPAA